MNYTHNTDEGLADKPIYACRACILAFRRLKMVEISGGCHCGAVRFSATLPDVPVPALECNCSICMMTGYLHIIVPRESFELVSGRSALACYRFGTGAAEHLFCSVCGVKSFYQPRSHPGAWSVNARCLDEPVELAVEPFDGRDWERSKARLDEGRTGG